MKEEFGRPPSARSPLISTATLSLSMASAHWTRRIPRSSKGSTVWTTCSSSPARKPRFRTTSLFLTERFGRSGINPRRSGSSGACTSTFPGYDNGKERYPVFYLLHGGGDEDSGWSTIGRAGFIIDNLIAEKKAQPMIVVMPNG